MIKREFSFTNFSRDINIAISDSGYIQQVYMDKGVLICTVWNAGEKNLYYKVFDLSSVDLNGESILISEQVLKFCIDLTHKIEFVCLDMIGTM